MLHWCCHYWKHRQKASFGIFWNSAIVFDLMSSMLAKHVPLSPIFIAGNSQKALGARSGKYSSWVMTRMFFSARNCYTTSDMWLGALSWGRNHCPLSLVALLLLNCIAQPLQNLHIEMTRETLFPGDRNSWCTKLSMSKNSGNFLAAPRISSYICAFIYILLVSCIQFVLE
jgi:hypothetical protein